MYDVSFVLRVFRHKTQVRAEILRQQTFIRFVMVSWSVKRGPLTASTHLCERPSSYRIVCHSL